MKMEILMRCFRFSLIFILVHGTHGRLIAETGPSVDLRFQIHVRAEGLKQREDTVGESSRELESSREAG